MIDIHKIFIEVRHHFRENMQEHLTYHNWAHTLAVYRNVQHIGLKEKLTQKKINLLKIAALFHDIGYLDSNIDHEERGCDIAADWLSRCNISLRDLQAIKGMIMATKLPQQPKNQMENVIADADLLYLGTSKYKEISEKLFSEFQFYNPALDQKKWHNLQIDFLSSHSYHTAFCKRYYAWKKRNTLDNIIEGKARE